MADRYRPKSTIQRARGAGQYRTQLARYIRELGLSPSARTSITPPESEEDDSDVWD